MCNCHSVLECYVMFAGVKLSVRSFNLFMTKLKLKLKLTSSVLSHGWISLILTVSINCL